VGNETAVLQKDYLTTTDLARLCGVSRFTIINWVNQGRINAVKTFGGHRRIPVREAISIFETSRLEIPRKEQTGSALGSLGHCWEYRSRRDHGTEGGNCRDCLVHGRDIDYCFAVVRQFGKEVIRCDGDCLNCEYFEELFRLCDDGSCPKASPKDKPRAAAVKRKRFLDSFAYNMGRGVHGLKERIAGIRDRFARRSRSVRVENRIRNRSKANEGDKPKARKDDS